MPAPVFRSNIGGLGFGAFHTSSDRRARVRSGAGLLPGPYSCLQSHYSNDVYSRKLGAEFIVGMVLVYELGECLRGARRRVAREE